MDAPQILRALRASGRPGLAKLLTPMLNTAPPGQVDAIEVLDAAALLRLWRLCEGRYDFALSAADVLGGARPGDSPGPAVLGDACFPYVARGAEGIAELIASVVLMDPTGHRPPRRSSLYRRAVRRLRQSGELDHGPHRGGIFLAARLLAVDGAEAYVRPAYLRDATSPVRTSHASVLQPSAWAVENGTAMVASRVHRGARSQGSAGGLRHECLEG